VTAEYHLLPRVHSRTDTRGGARRRRHTRAPTPVTAGRLTLPAASRAVRPRA
jgi:hypothetical protein